jgi:hypothetical protein
MAPKESEKEKDSSKVHKLALRGSAKLVAEFVRPLPRDAFILDHS